MSDGNFNRALLPPTPYASGVRMGSQQTKAKALNALLRALEQAVPPLSEEQKESVVGCFKEMMK